MVIINIFLISFYIILLLSNFFIETYSIGEIWKNTHINSLIGFQKSIEKLEFNNNLDFNIWYSIILPILETPILLFLTIISTLAFLFLGTNKLLKIDF